MKRKILTCLMALFCVVTFAQIEVNQAGNVGIGGSNTTSDCDLYVAGRSKFNSNVFNHGPAYFYNKAYFRNVVDFSYGVSYNSNANFNSTANFYDQVVVDAYGGNYALKVTGEYNTYALRVDGKAYCTGGVWESSDERLKKNVKPLKSSGVLAKLKSLEAKEYEFKGNEELEKDYKKNVKKFRTKHNVKTKHRDNSRFLEKDSLELGTLAVDSLASGLSANDSLINDTVYMPQLPEGRQFGFIAQEVNEIYPELVTCDSLTGYFSINYIGFVPLLWEAVKEQTVLLEDLQQQQAENDALKKQVAKLEDEMAAIRKEIQKLKRK